MTAQGMGGGMAGTRDASLGRDDAVQGGMGDMGDMGGEGTGNAQGSVGGAGDTGGIGCEIVMACGISGMDSSELGLQALDWSGREAACEAQAAGILVSCKVFDFNVFAARNTRTPPTSSGGSTSA